jgi:hypothetical protein
VFSFRLLPRFQKAIILSFLLPRHNIFEAQETQKKIPGIFFVKMAFNRKIDPPPPPNRNFCQNGLQKA